MSTPATDALVGSVLDGRYRVLSHIADGGMASVYVALDERLGREVAVKVMKPSLAGDPVFVARFQREARAAAQLSHPGVVSVFDQGSDGGHVFLVMELVNGKTLREVMQTEGPLTPRAALDFLDQILQALGAAHAAGLVHRDVKPENVILRADGAVKVADFGLARAAVDGTGPGVEHTAATGVLLGTVAYLAPEQVELGVADSRSDVYSAGLLLFEMLTGTKAFTGDSAIQVAYQHVHGTVPTPSSRVADLPPALDALVAFATARHPDDRPRDADAFLKEERRVRAGLSADQLDRRPDAAGDGAAAAPGVATVAVPQTQIVPLPARDPVGSATQVVPLPAPQPQSEVTRAIGRPPAAVAAEQQPGVGSLLESSTATAEPPQRRRAPWWIAFCLLLVAVAAAGAWFFLAGPGAKTTVPTLAGQTEAAATARLTAAHLNAEVRTAYSEGVKSGVVISSDPTSGTSLARDTSVSLMVSRGRERHTVPTLKGQTQSDAEQRLTDARLALGTVTTAYDSSVPTGQVVSSSPNAGASLKRDAKVDLVISKGRRPITVADWTGKTVADATAALEKQGLTVDSSQQQFSTTVAKGSVISQDPAAGAKLFKGDRVALAVSQGPQDVSVPDVTLKSVDDATTILKAAGFKVAVNNVIGGTLVGRVTSQFPSAGTMAPAGSVVTLTVI